MPTATLYTFNGSQHKGRDRIPALDVPQLYNEHIKYCEKDIATLLKESVIDFVAGFHMVRSTGQSPHHIMQTISADTPMSFLTTCIALQTRHNDNTGHITPEDVQAHFPPAEWHDLFSFDFQEVAADFQLERARKQQQILLALSSDSFTQKNGEPFPQHDPVTSALRKTKDLTPLFCTWLTDWQEGSSIHNLARIAQQIEQAEDKDEEIRFIAAEIVPELLEATPADIAQDVQIARINAVARGQRQTLFEDDTNVTLLSP